MGNVHRISAAQVVGVGVDYEMIRNLKKAVGDRRYEELAEEAVFALADGLGLLERALREADLTMCYRHALHICSVASEIGLTEIMRVASDVLSCTREGNIEALSAVVGRLNRVAEASLFSVFDLEA